MTPDLAELLSKSDAAASLSVERSVARSLTKLAWTVTQGAIYTDPKENKLREIDSVARRAWRTRAQSPKTVFISMVVECKTMRGYHILFDGTPSSRFLGFHSVGLAHWIGYSVIEHKNRIRRLLTERQYNREEVIRALQRLDKTAFPGHMARLRGLLVEPPVFPSFTTFRETNIGSEKDLDNSVMWRAVSALDSCTTSLLASRMDDFFHDLEYGVEEHERHGLEKIKALQYSFENEARFAWLFHPVVVTDARLWAVRPDGTAPLELQAARYVRSDGVHGVNKWFDVVQREHIDEYFGAVTKYYNKSFIKRRAYGSPE